MKSVFGTKELKPKLNAIALNPPGPRIRIFARGANLISTVCGGRVSDPIRPQHIARNLGFERELRRREDQGGVGGVA